MTTYGTIDTIIRRLAILATNNRGKTLAEYETEHRRKIQNEAERKEREAWARAGEQLKK